MMNCSEKVSIPTPERLFQIGELILRGISVEKIHEETYIDFWFLDQLQIIVEEREYLEGLSVETISNQGAGGQRLGFSDEQLGYLWNTETEQVRKARIKAGVIPVYKTVDTCSAEFEAHTPYHYSTYEDTTEVAPSEEPVVILGSRS